MRWDSVNHDLRYALRTLRRDIGFLTAAILIIALGIGANTAIFSVMNAVVLRDLPLPNPQRVLFLHTTDRPGGSSQTGHGDLEFPVHIFETLRLERGAFSDLVASVPLGVGKTPVRYGREPEEAHADMVSGDFFTGLGIKRCDKTANDAFSTRRAYNNFAIGDERCHGDVIAVFVLFDFRCPDFLAGLCIDRN